MMENRSKLTVSQLTEYIKGIIDSDRVLSGVYVTGEISNFKYYSSGHLYFTIKDENAAISAVMFRSAATRLRFVPEDGMKIIASGRVSVYPTQGKYQLYVDSLTPDGIGALALQYEQTKNRLEKEGLFDVGHKKPLPPFPKVIGVVTSPTGAVIRDIINVCSRRFPYAKILLYPAIVQGDGAVETLIDGVNFFSLSKCADVVIIGRGGGSMEDLWCFNCEALARVIYNAEVPIISAVGHQTDSTICDFVSDVYAPTPSAAAELAVPDTSELLKKLGETSDRLYLALKRGISVKGERLKKLSGSYVLKNPERLFEAKKLRIDNISDRLDSRMKYAMDKSRSSFERTVSKLEALSPLAVLSRGYSAVYSGEKLVRSVNDVSEGDKLRLTLSDGSLNVTVQD